jgi:hypothetical protein
MTFNKDNDDHEPKLASEHWIDSYNTSTHVDLDNFETFTTQFLEQANKPDTSAENLIKCVCNNTFSGVAFSSMAKYRTEPDETELIEAPILNIVHHPFKESRLENFSKKEALYGIVVRANPKEEIRTVEFIKPIELFTRLKIPTTTGTNTLNNDETQQEDKTGDGETKLDSDNLEHVPTPSFMDFFGDSFINKDKINEEYQPLNNATEIKPFLDPDNKEQNQHKDFPDPIYYPRKVILLTPTMIRIILEEGPDKFDAIINGIRKYAWFCPMLGGATGFRLDDFLSRSRSRSV